VIFNGINSANCGTEVTFNLAVSQPLLGYTLRRLPYKRAFKISNKVADRLNR